MLRFIVDTAQSAAFNMAADLFLLEQCFNSSTVYVRFYLWATPTITLGYMQKPDDVLDLRRMGKIRYAGSRGQPVEERCSMTVISPTVAFSLTT
jgi:lipoate-protein ligase A